MSSLFKTTKLLSTLESGIDVHVRLLIFGKFSHLYGLIPYCTFINFSPPKLVFCVCCHRNQNLFRFQWFLKKNRSSQGKYDCEIMRKLNNKTQNKQPKYLSKKLFFYFSMEGGLFLGQFSPFPPIRLFHTVRLLFMKKVPTCTFIPTCTSIQDSRVIM